MSGRSSNSFSSITRSIGGSCLFFSSLCINVSATYKKLVPWLWVKNLVLVMISLPTLVAVVTLRNSINKKCAKDKNLANDINNTIKTNTRNIRNKKKTMATLTSVRTVPIFQTSPMSPTMPRRHGGSWLGIASYQRNHGTIVAPSSHHPDLTAAFFHGVSLHGIVLCRHGVNFDIWSNPDFPAQIIAFLLFG